MSVYERVYTYLIDHDSRDPKTQTPARALTVELAARAEFSGVKLSTLQRHIYRARRAISLAPPVREIVEESSSSGAGSYSAEYDPATDSYTIEAGEVYYEEDFPACEVQDMIQWYVHSSGRMTQTQVAREAYKQHKRVLSKKELRGIFRALEVTKDSLPIAPHLLDTHETEELVPIVRRAQEAAIETRVRAEDAAYWRTQYVNARKKDANIEQLVASIGDAIIRSEPIKFPSIRFDTKLEPFEGVLVLSDWHVGRCFRTHLNQYNKTIFQRRIHALFQTISEHFRAYKRPMSHLHIAVGGDMVEAALPMRKQHNLEMDLHEGEQVYAAAQSLSWLINGVASLVSVDTTVWSVGGNHDRAGGDRSNDPNRLIAQILSYLTQEMLPKKIKWHHTTETVQGWRIYDTQMLLTHGDSAPRDPMTLTRGHRRPGINNYVVMTGHYHSPMLTQNYDTLWLQSGSLVGPDPYASNKMGKGAPPSQLFLEVHKSGPRPVTVLPVSMGPGGDL